MEVTINTELFRTLGVTPAVVLAVCQASPELTTREIAELLGRDYSRTTTIVKDLKKRGYLQNANSLQNAKPNSLQNAKLAPEILQNANFFVLQNANSLQNAKETEKERKQEKETFPPYNPLYKEKEINKEKEKESDGDETCVRAHVCEVAAAADVKTDLTSITKQPVITHLNAEQSLEAVAQHAKLHPVSLEQFCMTNYLTADDFARLAEEIKTEWILTGVTSVSGYDARNHFYNTMRKKAAQLRQERAKTLGRTEKLTWSPDERLYLRPDCTEREREAYRQERERRARIEKENEKDLPF